MPHIPELEASGGLVVDPEGRILFIFKDGKWDLPKGLIDGDFDHYETAVHEVEEETGIDRKLLAIEDELIPTHNISKYRKVKYLKRTRWFHIRIQETTTVFKPQTEEGIEHCEWIAPWELDKVYANCPSRIRYLLDYWKKYRKL